MTPGRGESHEMTMIARRGPRRTANTTLTTANARPSARNGAPPSWRSRASLTIVDIGRIGASGGIGQGRLTEGFYDTAQNEADDARTTRNCTKASPRGQTRKVCRRPSVKTMLHDAGIAETVSIPNSVKGNGTRTESVSTIQLRLAFATMPRARLWPHGD